MAYSRPVRAGCSGAGEDDERLGSRVCGKARELVGAEAVVVGVAAPERVGVIAARGIGADAFFPLVGGGEGAAGPADEGGAKIRGAPRRRSGRSMPSRRTSARIRETKSSSRAPCPAAVISTEAWVSRTWLVRKMEPPASRFRQVRAEAMR